MIKHTLLILSTFLFSSSVFAKEDVLNLTVNTVHTMTVHYRFLADGKILGKGKLRKIHNGQKYYVYVNRIPDNQTVLVQVYKMTAGNRTEINDPCEIKLPSPYLNANITIGFKGNPYTHGSFNCAVSKALTNTLKGIQNG